MPAFDVILETNDLHALRDPAVVNSIETDILNTLRYYTEAMTKPIRIKFKIENTTSMTTYANTFYSQVEDTYIIEFSKIKYDKSSDAIVYNSLKFKTLYECIGFFIGVVEHEIGHIHHTYTKSNKFFQSEDIIKIVWGILEDGRIEHIIKEEHPSMSVFIDHMNNMIFSDVVIREDKLSSVLAALNYKVIMHSDPSITNNRTMSIYNEINEVLIDDIYICDSPDDLYDTVIEIVNILQRHFNNLDMQDIVMEFPENNSVERIFNRAYYNDMRIHIERTYDRASERTSSTVSDTDILETDDTTSSMSADTDINDDDVFISMDDSDEWSDDTITDIKTDIRKSILKSPRVMIDKVVILDMKKILLKIHKTPYEIIAENVSSIPKDILENARELNQTLSRVFRYIEERYKFNYYSTRGRVLSKKLYRVAEERITNKPAQVFLKRRSMTKVNITITILLDMSSSMKKHDSVLRKIGTTLLYALSNFRGVNIGIYGFSSITMNSGLKIIEFKPYTTPISKIHFGMVSSIGKYSVIIPENTTPMHGALEFVYKLSKRVIPNTNHLYFIITDGLPSDKTRTRNVIEHYELPTYAIYYNSNPRHEIIEGLRSLFGENVALATTYQATMDIIKNDIHNFIIKTYTREES